MSAIEIRIQFSYNVISFAQAIVMLQRIGFTEFAAEQYLYSE